jgi:hypothetical protein
MTKAASANQFWADRASKLEVGSVVSYAEMGVCVRKLKYDTRESLPPALRDCGLAPWTVPSGAVMTANHQSFVTLVDPSEELVFDLPMPDPKCMVVNDSESAQMHYLERIGFLPRLLGVESEVVDLTGDSESANVDFSYRIGAARAELRGTLFQADIRHLLADVDILVVGEAKRSPDKRQTSQTLRQVMPPAFTARANRPGLTVVPIIIVSDSPMVVAGGATDQWTGRAYLLSLPEKNVADTRIERAVNFVVNHH